MPVDSSNLDIVLSSTSGCSLNSNRFNSGDWMFKPESEMLGGVLKKIPFRAKTPIAGILEARFETRISPGL